MNRNCPGKKFRSAAGADSGNITSISPRLSLGEIRDQSFQASSSRISVVNVTGDKHVRRRALALAMVDKTKCFVTRYLVEHHGQQIELGVQTLPATLHFVDVLQSQKTPRRQT